MLQTKLQFSCHTNSKTLEVLTTVAQRPYGKSYNGSQRWRLRTSLSTSLAQMKFHATMALYGQFKSTRRHTACNTHADSDPRLVETLVHCLLVASGVVVRAPPNPSSSGTINRVALTASGTHQFSPAWHRLSWLRHLLPIGCGMEGGGERRCL